MNLLYGIVWGLLGQVGSFMQLQGAMKLGWYPKYFWPMMLLSVPIGVVYVKSVEYFVVAFNGEIWPSRLIGFGLGIVVFSLLSHYFFKEPFTLKTLICLILGVSIIAIQVLWK
jgi:multidrug transporter EmrE-like cation transporter